MTAPVDPSANRPNISEVAQSSGVTPSQEKTNIANAMNLNVALASINAISQAFDVMGSRISDTADLLNTNTALETNMSSMTSLVTFAQGNANGKSGLSAATLASPSFHASLSAAVGAFDNMYTTGQTKNPTLNSETLSVNVENPSGHGYKTEHISAASLTNYWKAWQASAASSFKPPSKIPENLVTTDGSTHVSGMQNYMVQYIQQQLSQPSGMIKLKPGESLATALQSRLMGAGSMLQPSFSGTQNEAISQMWNVLTNMPSGQSPTPPGYPPITEYTGIHPSSSLIDNLFSGSKGGIEQNLQWMSWVSANSTSGSSPTAAQNWVTANSVSNQLSTMSSSLSQAQQAINTTSQTLTQQVQMDASNFQIMDSAASKIVSSFANMISSILQKMVSG